MEKYMMYVERGENRAKGTLLYGIMMGTGTIILVVMGAMMTIPLFIVGIFTKEEKE